MLSAAKVEPDLASTLKEEIALRNPLEPVRPGDSWTIVRGVDGSAVKP